PDVPATHVERERLFTRQAGTPSDREPRLQRLLRGGVVVSPEVAEPGPGEAPRSRCRVRVPFRHLPEGVAGDQEVAREEGREPEHRLEPATALVGKALAEAFGNRERRSAMRDHGAVGERLGGARRGTLVVVEGALPVLTTLEVVGERLVELGEAVGVQL